MPTARWLLTSSVVDGKIYAIAGQSSDDVNNPETELDVVEMYDPATDTWTTRTPIPTARAALASAVVNGKIYAIAGGIVEVTFSPYLLATSVVEEYDPATDAWSTKKPTISAQFGCAIGVVNDMIYVMGGNGTVALSVSPTPLVMSYDPGNDRWRALGLIMPTARGHLGAGAVDGIIYAVGGSAQPGQRLSVVQAYDPSINLWSTKAPMPTARVDFGIGVIGDKIYVVGGGTVVFLPNSARDVVEVYDTGSATAVEDNPGAPASFELRQNYPNPFNPETTIEYSLAREAMVTIRILNAKGQTVRTLTHTAQPVGIHNVVWDGRDREGLRVASGVYLYRVEAVSPGNSVVQIRKMLLLQ